MKPKRIKRAWPDNHWVRTEPQSYSNCVASIENHDVYLMGKVPHNGPRFILFFGRGDLDWFTFDHGHMWSSHSTHLDRVPPQVKEWVEAYANLIS